MVGCKRGVYLVLSGVRRMGSITVLESTKWERTTYRCHDFLVPMYSKLTHERIVVLGYDASNQEMKIYQYRFPTDERSLERRSWVSERY